MVMGSSLLKSYIICAALFLHVGVCSFKSLNKELDKTLKRREINDLLDLIREIAGKTDEPDTEVIFYQGMDGYATFRVPALVYHRGYFLAFCEGRIGGVEDSSAAEIVMKRGNLHNGTQVVWDDKVTVVASIPGIRLANPVPIVDTVKGNILLAYNVLYPGVEKDDYLQQDRYNQSLLLIKSADEGLTWSKPINITQQTLGEMKHVPVFYAPGPGHGIQMKSGRLVLQGNFYNRDMNPSHKKYEFNTSDHSVVFLSDNHGLNWRPGGFIPYGEDETGRPIHTSEAAVVELSNDNLCLNARTLTKIPRLPRAQSFSSDGGETFGQPQVAKQLIEPQNTGPTAGCMASVIGFPALPNPGTIPKSSKNDTNLPWVLFSNPADQFFRLKLSIRLSMDGCQKWSDPWTIWPLASAYSDMVYIGDRMDEDDTNDEDRRLFAILYERGVVVPTQEMAFRMFTLDDVINGIQRN